jgi:hypothetical protein
MLDRIDNCTEVQEKFFRAGVVASNEFSLWKKFEAALAMPFSI